jgi:hypothetical protein
MFLFQCFAGEIDHFLGTLDNISGACAEGDNLYVLAALSVE